MFRKSILALATLAFAAVAPMTAVQADSYGSGTSYQKKCHWERKRVRVGYDSYGNPIYKWKRWKVCA